MTTTVSECKEGHKKDCDIYSNVGIPSAQKDESYCTCAKTPTHSPTEDLSKKLANLSSISQCPSCYCMTHSVKNGGTVEYCGKCSAVKPASDSPTEPTVEKWDMSCKPNGATFMITDFVFNAIEWEKHYTVKERQSLNDVVDEIIGKAVASSVQEAKAEGAREERERCREITQLTYQLGVKEERQRVVEMISKLKPRGFGFDKASMEMGYGMCKEDIQSELNFPSDKETL